METNSFDTEAGNASTIEKPNRYASAIWTGQNMTQHVLYSKRQHDADKVDQPAEASDSKDHTHKKQGTFLGVYVPTVYTMWGVLIFIRFGVLVGNSGWLMAVGFTFLAFTAQVLTTLSLCTIASNQESHDSGIYGMLVHNLGGVVSSAIGLLYYLGMTFLASVELLGSVQVIDRVISVSITGQDSVTGSAYFDQIAIGGALLIILAIIRIFNIRLLHKLSVFILFILMLSFVAGFAGLFATLGGWKVDEEAGITGLDARTLRDNTFPDFSEDSEVPSPRAAMALIFPSFLGVFQGANNAKNLKNPETSMVKGTLLACFSSLVLYTLMFMMLAAVATRETLKEDTLIFSSLSYPTQYIGYVGSALVGVGACLELLEIGPTILQQIAIVGDHKFLKAMRLHKSSKSGQPIYAIAVSFVINLLLLFLGSKSFEILAQTVTIWFLQAYGTMHLACFINERYLPAGWRPRFIYYHWSTSLLGVIFTIALMFFVSWEQSVVTVALEIILMTFIQFVEQPRQSGLGLRGIILHKALGLLLREQAIYYDGKENSYMAKYKFWSPQVLCFVVQDQESGEVCFEHKNLLRWVGQLQEHSRSVNLTIVGSIRVHDDSEPDQKVWHHVCEKNQEMEQQLYKQMNEIGLKGFPRVIISDDAEQARDTFSQTTGMGTLHPNLIIIPWETPNKHTRLCQGMRGFINRCKANRQSVILLKGLKTFPEDKELNKLSGTIDIWWLVHNGGLPVLIGHLLRLRSAWRTCKLRIFVAIQDDEISDNILTQTKLETKELLQTLRVPNAEIIVVPVVKGTPSLFSLGTSEEAESYMNTSKLNQLFSSLSTASTVQQKRPQTETPQESYCSGSVTSEDPANSMQTEQSLSRSKIEMELRNVPSENDKVIRNNVCEDIEKGSNIKREVAITIFSRLLEEHSSTAELVILNMPPPTTSEELQTGEGTYERTLDRLTGGLRRVALVAATGDESIKYG